jgi:O-antigen biosynthesis protein WbqV
MVDAACLTGRSASPPRRKLTARLLLVVTDATLAALALLLAVCLRVGDNIGPALLDSLKLSVPLFAGIAVSTFYALGLYQKVWRYASIADLAAIVKAATLAVALFVITLFLLTRLEAFPRSTPIIQWLVMVALLSGARFAYRVGSEGAFRPARVAIAASSRPAGLLVGAGDSASLFLQALRHDLKASCRPVGILDPSGQHVGLRLRGVPVLGTPRDLAAAVERLATQGSRPEHLIIADDTARLGGPLVRELVREGESLGLVVSRLPSPTELRRADGRIELRPIELTDLLSRPQAMLDRAAIDRLIEGRRVLVTGAGGTIGGELTRQIAALRPARLILVEASEFNLYSIDLALAEAHPGVLRVPVLCNVRERDRVLQVFAEHRPELVFHAAALKHVPMVELNPCEGVLTNVVGTRNVADAACRCGALAMVQVSSDKAVNPTSVMGATKRLAELYCQALDLQGRGDPSSPRLMTVRFGNVLGSSGSLIPLFERQLARGGPLTVTHPEIKRYFMTVREAVELVLQASAHGLARREGLGQIFVLDMGEPVRIIDIARRMIRLAGLQPDQEVRIDITGLRPGEKLYEELFDAAEERLPASAPGVLGALSRPMPLAELQAVCDSLGEAATTGDTVVLRELISGALPSYQPWIGGSPLPARPVADPAQPLMQDEQEGALLGTGTVAHA